MWFLMYQSLCTSYVLILNTIYFVLRSVSHNTYYYLLTYGCKEQSTVDKVLSREKWTVGRQLVPVKLKCVSAAVERFCSNDLLLRWQKYLERHHIQKNHQTYSETWLLWRPSISNIIVCMRIDNQQGNRRYSAVVRDLGHYIIKTLERLLICNAWFGLP